jgi:hypothetical protein
VLVRALTDGVSRVYRIPATEPAYRFPLKNPWEML